MKKAARYLLNLKQTAVVELRDIFSNRMTKIVGARERANRRKTCLLSLSIPTKFCPQRTYILNSCLIMAFFKPSLNVSISEMRVRAATAEHKCANTNVQGYAVRRGAVHTRTLKGLTHWLHEHYNLHKVFNFYNCTYKYQSINAIALGRYLQLLLPMLMLTVKMKYCAIAMLKQKRKMKRKKTSEAEA